MNASVSAAALALFTAVLLGLPGCGQSEEARLAKAQQRIEQRDRAGALVELKSLLQKNPDSAKGRHLLGKAQLAAGDAAAAEAEFTRALQLGQSPDDVMPDLAEALLAQGKATWLVNQYGSTRLTQVGPAATFLTYLAEARAIDGSQLEAGRILAEALRLQPDHAAARLLEARLVAAGGDAALAMKQIDALLARVPSHADAWVFKADLLKAQGGEGAAAAVAAAYAKALEAMPGALAAHVGLLTLQMQQGNFEAARQQQQAMAKALPRHAKTLYFDALLAQQRGDDRHARELAQLLLKRLPDDPQVLMLAGRSELRAGAFGQAEALLVKAMQVAPQEAGPRQLLAQVLLRTGQAERALGVLRPLTAAAMPDVEALLLAAQASLQKGDAAEAERNFQRASQARPNDPRIQLARTMAKLGKGNDDVALAELQALADADKVGSEATVATISAHLSRKEYDAALKALDALVARQPKLAWPDDLRGRIALQRQDPAAARRSFDQALAKDADHYPSIAMLVALDLADKKPADALARLDALLKRRPTHLEVQLARIEINARGGAPRAEVRAGLEEVVRTHPIEPMAHRVLIDHFVAVGDSRQALAAARAAVSALPDHVELLERLGRAQQAVGELVQAESTFKRLTELQSGRSQPHLRLAEIELLRNQVDAARNSIKRARELDPGNPEALRAELAMAMREKRHADAMALAREMQKRRPGDMLGLMLQGDVEANQGRWAEAQAAYRQALAKAPQSTEAVMRLHTALFEGGKRAEADQLAAQWQASHPDDVAFLHLRASATLARKDWAGAEAQYLELQKRRPDDVLALNNLAVALVRLNKPGAVPLAEQAVKLAPAQVAVLDTLAMALAADKQIGKAIEWQRKAVDLAPQAGGLRMTLAKLYLESGDKARARDELQTLARAGPGFPDQPEVARLLADLGPAMPGDLPTAASPAEPPLPRQPVATANASPQTSDPSGETESNLALVAVLVGSAVAVLIPVGLVVAALRPAVFRVERSMAVAATAPTLYALLQDFHQWPSWSLWPQFDASTTRSFAGAESGMGAVCKWVGSGRSTEGFMEVMNAVPSSQLAIEVCQTHPVEHRHAFEFLLSADPAGGTLVRMVAHGPAPYLSRVAGLVWSADRRIGKALSANLGRLKAAVEPLSATPPAG